MSTNGLLTFRGSYYEYSPRRFNNSVALGLPLIAAYWADVNIRRFGNIFYRQTNETGDIQTAEYYINAHLSLDFGFRPTSLFIATWVRVAQFGQTSDEVSI